MRVEVTLTAKRFLALLLHKTTLDAVLLAVIKLADAGGAPLQLFHGVPHV